MTAICCSAVFAIAFALSAIAAGLNAIAVTPSAIASAAYAIAVAISAVAFVPSAIAVTASAVASALSAVAVVLSAIAFVLSAIAVILSAVAVILSAVAVILSAVAVAVCYAADKPYWSKYLSWVHRCRHRFWRYRGEDSNKRAAFCRKTEKPPDSTAERTGNGSAAGTALKNTGVFTCFFYRAALSYIKIVQRVCAAGLVRMKRNMMLSLAALAAGAIGGLAATGIGCGSDLNRDFTLNTAEKSVAAPRAGFEITDNIYLIGPKGEVSKPIRGTVFDPIWLCIWGPPRTVKIPHYWRYANAAYRQALEKAGFDIVEYYSTSRPGVDCYVAINTFQIQGYNKR